MAARVPWGSPAAGPSYASPGPNYPPYPPSQHANGSRQRAIYPQPGISTEPGFYSAALSSVGGFAPPPGPSSYVSSPIASYPQTPISSPPSSHIPAMLQPGNMDRRPSLAAMRANSGDLFFQGSSAFPMPHIQQPPPVPPVPQSHYPHPRPPQLRHSQSTPPPLPFKPFNNPPIPPKPYGFSVEAAPPPVPTHPQSIINPQPHRPYDPQSAPAIPDPRDSPFAPVGYGREPEEDPEFKRALEMSAQFERENARKRQQTLRQEDEDIARAVQESLKLSSSMVPMPEPFSVPDIPMQMPIPSPSGPRSHDSHSSFSPPLSSNHSIHDDASVASHSFTSSPPSVLSQISEDEALARRLVEHEDRARSPASSQPHSPIPTAAHPVPQLAQSSSLSLSPNPSQSSPYSPSTPPMYNTVVASVLSGSGSSSAPNKSPSLAPNRLPAPTAISAPATPSKDPARLNTAALGRSTSALASSPSASPSKPVDTRTGRSGSLDSAHPNAGSPHPQTAPSTPTLGSEKTTLTVNGSSSASSSGHSSGHGSTLSTVDEAPEGSGRQRASSSVAGRPPASSPGPTGGANQYVDQELLRGVSLGFNPPVIRPDLAPLQGPIPNVIALPYGRAPPFHLKAPSWRDLLKLMARLSGTRLEPTIEALSQVKSEMRVRVVVNFVKVHQNTSDWHVVLYMTIDQPVPQNHPQKFKYKNGDPNTLPFSYTMSATPAYLREGADAPISKWYSIPATSGLPHPKLPVTFPDLATYLLDALEESRKALHDSSSGLRRLAKLIETCYPSDRTEERSGRERGVGNWVRGFLGRERQRSRDRNEHTFDVVTPFVPDEWGG